MKLDEVRLGDTVRLRNGEEILVSDKMTGYTDREGEHPGPFVATRPGFDRYHLDDVQEVVLRNERLCRFCGEGVTATKSETDFCSLCFYSGRAFTEQRGELLEALQTLPRVESASVWHTGGGCFLLAVTLKDGRLITVTEGQGGLPDPGEPWQLLVVAPDMEAWDEWDEKRLDLREGAWTDEELIAEVETISGRRRQRPRINKAGLRVHRIKSSLPDFTGGYVFNVPARLARLAGPDREFTVEMTEEGILYRYAGGGDPVELPTWLREGK